MSVGDFFPGLTSPKPVIPPPVEVSAANAILVYDPNKIPQATSTTTSKPYKITNRPKFQYKPISSKFKVQIKFE